MFGRLVGGLVGDSWSLGWLVGLWILGIGQGSGCVADARFGFHSSFLLVWSRWEDKNPPIFISTQHKRMSYDPQPHIPRISTQKPPS